MRVDELFGRGEEVVLLEIPHEPVALVQPTRPPRAVHQAPFPLDLHRVPTVVVAGAESLSDFVFADLRVPADDLHLQPQRLRQRLEERGIPPARRAAALQHIRRTLLRSPQRYIVDHVVRDPREGGAGLLTVVVHPLAQVGREPVGGQRAGGGRRASARIDQCIPARLVSRGSLHCAG